jgi:beta-lactamase regulating signal transducer with metallopeptidase domain
MILSTPLLDGVCRMLLPVGITLLIQSTLLLIVGLLAGSALRRWGPALQSLIYRVTLAGVVLVAVLAVCVAERPVALWRIPVSPPDTAPVASPLSEPSVPTPPTGERSAADAGVDSETAVWPGVAPPREPGGASRSAGSWGRFPVGVVGLWCLGALLSLAWSTLCHLYVLDLRRKSRPVSSHVALAALHTLSEGMGVRPPLLLESARVRSPFLFGLWRPAILLPSSHLSDYDAFGLRAVLIHELAHLARGDCWWNLLARLCCAVGWVQPLLWILCRRLEQASEEVCDLEEVRRGCSPREYARCLVTLAERFLPSIPERAAGAGVVTFRSSLSRRVQQILRAASMPAAPLNRRVRISVVLGAACAVALGLSLVSTAAPPQFEATKAGQPTPASRAATTGPVMSEDRARGAGITIPSRIPLGTELDSGKARRPPPAALGAPARAPEQPAGGAVVVGRVLYEDGKPAAGAHVEARPQTGFRGRDPVRKKRQAVTRKDGSYRIPGLPEGQWVVVINSSGSPRWVGYPAVSTPVQLKPGGETRCPDLVLVPAAFIVGTVVDARTGQPLSAIEIASSAADEPEPRSFGLVRTDAMGRFRLQEQPGRWEICIHGRYEGRKNHFFRSEHRTVVELQKGETKEITFRVDPRRLNQAWPGAAPTGLRRSPRGLWLRPGIDPDLELENLLRWNPPSFQRGPVDEGLRQPYRW